MKTPLSLGLLLAAGAAGAANAPFRPTLDQIEEYAKPPAARPAPPPGQGRTYVVGAAVARDGSLDLRGLAERTRSMDDSGVARGEFAALSALGDAALARAEALEYLYAVRAKLKVSRAQRDAMDRAYARTDDLAQLRLVDLDIQEKGEHIRRLEAAEKAVAAKERRLDVQFFSLQKGAKPPREGVDFQRIGR